jgi:hypothetical protein
VLPYLEGTSPVLHERRRRQATAATFLPFSNDPALRALWNKRTPNPNSTAAASLRGAPIEVRRLALVAFRDQIILPHAGRLARAFFAASLAYTSPLTGGRRGSLASVTSGSTALPGEDSGGSGATGAGIWTGRRMQMLGLIASAQTGNEAQATVEALVRALRGDVRAPRSRGSTPFFRSGDATRSPSPESSGLEGDGTGGAARGGPRGSPKARRKAGQRTGLADTGLTGDALSTRDRTAAGGASTTDESE